MLLSRTMTAPTNLRSQVERVDTSRAMFMKYSSHEARARPPALGGKSMRGALLRRSPAHKSGRPPCRAPAQPRPRQASAAAFLYGEVDKPPRSRHLTSMLRPTRARVLAIAT